MVWPASPLAIILVLVSPPSFSAATTAAGAATTFVASPMHSRLTIDAVRLSMHASSSERTGRRAVLSSVLKTTVAAAASPAAVLFSPPSVAGAVDELFKPNPLTNPVLEKLRIWEQAEKDELQYGGELASGTAPKGDRTIAYAKLLVPILEIESDLLSLNVLVREPNGQGLDRASDILSKAHFDKIQFKKTFNAFGDNIYYSDPDRANAYLGGGATPKNEQSIAYLLRNDILTNVEALQAEVAYVLKQKNKGETLETEDLYLYAQMAKDSMGKYLEVVPPNELRTARESITSL